MVSVLTIISGVATIVFGFYLFIEKEGFGAVLGAIFSILGLLVTLFGIVSALVPGFFP